MKPKEKRLEWVKANGPCQHCGSHDNLEVDHLNPKTKVDHRIWSWAEERRELELEKCQVLCSRCNRRKAIREHGRTAIHGESIWLYQQGCRCEKCKTVKSVDNKKRIR